MQDNKDNKKEKSEEFEFKGSYQKKYENIKNLLQSAFNQLEKIQNAMETLEQEERREHYQSIPGTEGVFDGQYLVAQDGRKTEVPQNYASKSKLVYGDILKVFNDSGKQIFKQIDRVERKKIEGVLAKKEGKWYLLSDSGSYRISDVSAEFNKAQLNDKASALIPAENQKVPFASLDKIYRGFEPRAEKKDIGKFEVKKERPLKREISEKRIPKKEVEKEKSKPRTPVKSFNIKKETKKEEKPPKEYVNNIMEDDDLR